MIEIAVDGRPLQGQLSGVGKYVWQTILNILKITTNVTFTVYTNRPLEFKIEDDRISVYLDNRYQKLKPLLWSKFLLARLIKKNPPSFTFFGGTFTTVQKIPGKSIVVVHDLNHIYAKETMTKLHYYTHMLFFKHDIKKADFVICNSAGTSAKLKKLHNIQSDFILHPPIDERYKLLSNAEVENVLNSLGINYPYILTVATQEPRKNLYKTIQAFKHLKAQDEIKSYKLLLVGGKGWKNEEIQNLIISDPDIVELGYVDEHYLPYIYNGAKAFVFPSKYEGYGMPANEAILCGKKPVVSDIDELHEATSRYGYFIDPDNIKEYADTILKAVIFSATHKREDINNITQDRLAETNGLSNLLKITS